MTGASLDLTLGYRMLIKYPGLTCVACLAISVAEHTAIGVRAAADFPSTHTALRPRVLPYTASFLDEGVAWQLYGVQWVFVLLLVVACANVGTLIHARTATREGEIVVRNALGASRGRIVLQLFVEALVLASVAAAAGRAMAAWSIAYVMDLFWSAQETAAPFWWDDGLSTSTVIYVGVVTFSPAPPCNSVPACSPAWSWRGWSESSNPTIPRPVRRPSSPQSRSS